MKNRSFKHRNFHYFFVYNFLKELFLYEPFILINYLDDEETNGIEELWRISEAMAMGEGFVDSVIPSDGLSSSKFEIKNDTDGYIITLPEPLYIPEAYFVGLIHNKPRVNEFGIEYGYFRFFTLELTLDNDPENKDFRNKFVEINEKDRFYLDENIIPDYDVFKKNIITLGKKPDSYKPYSWFQS